MDRSFHATDYLTFPPSIDARVPITFGLLLRHVVPVHLAYYLTAVLVCTPNTRCYRMLLLPITLALAWVAATAFDMSGGDPQYKHLNYANDVVLFALVMRLLDWTFASEPLQRLRAPDEPPSHVCQDALDLAVNMRGIGWTWSRGTHIPSNPYVHSSRTDFAWAMLGRFLLTAVVTDALHHIVQSLDPTGFGMTAGGSIFDRAMPRLQRYARSSFVTVLCGTSIFLALEAGYALCAFLGTAVLRMSPAAWPPFSARPWAATSLARFWGRGWHQSFRRSFATLGAFVGRVLGPAGAVLGAFGVSGLLHDLSAWGMARGTAPAQIQAFFLAMGAGCVLERAWARATGRKVSGWAGWAWTMVWVIGWAHGLAEAYCSKGLTGVTFIPEQYRLGKALMMLLERGLSHGYGPRTRTRS